MRLCSVDLQNALDESLSKEGILQKAAMQKFETHFWAAL